jgi:hypothetical protein
MEKKRNKNGIKIRKTLQREVNTDLKFSIYCNTVLHTHTHQ